MNIQGITLSKRQREIAEAVIDSPYKYIVVSTGRQVGKSTVAGQIALHLVMNNSNYKVGFFLPTFKQAKEQFGRITKGLQALPDSIVTFNKTDLEIIFCNNSIVKFWTSENDNCRGYTYNSIIVDEACFVKDEIFSAAILATVLVSLSNDKGKVLLTSTPKEKNWFYDYFVDGMDNTQTDVKSFTFTSEEGGLISKDELERVKKRTDPSIYNNEYMAQFIEDGNGLFNYNNCLFTGASYEQSMNAYLNSTNKPDSQCVAGLDIGMKNDYTVLTIMEVVSGKVVFIKKWNQCDWFELMEEIAEIVKKFNNATLYVEVNGCGAMPFDTLKKLYSNTKKWVTSETSKVDIIQKLMKDVSLNDITLPKNELLLKELNDFGVKYVNGKPRYAATKGNDDMVMSLAICNYNRKTGSIMFGSGY
jgi:hypothetical protein